MTNLWQKHKWVVGILTVVVLVSVGVASYAIFAPKKSNDVLIAKGFGGPFYWPSSTEWVNLSEENIIPRASLIIRCTLEKQPDIWYAYRDDGSLFTSCERYDATIIEVYYDYDNMYQSGDCVSFADWSYWHASGEFFVKYVDGECVMILNKTIGTHHNEVEAAPFSIGDPFRSVILINENEYRFYPVFDMLMSYTTQGEYITLDENKPDTTKSQPVFFDDCMMEMISKYK